MKRWLLLLLLVGWAHASPALGPSTLIANVSGRTTISLNGAWRAIVDPFENGKSAGFFRDAKPHSKSDRVEYSFDASPVLNVPGDWNTQREQLMFYEGPVWYRREFIFHKRANTRVFVCFGAANYLTAVYLNGEKLGEHEGGFTPFNFDATSVLRDGENVLIVDPHASRCAGLSQPEGRDLESRSAQVGVLYAAEVLQEIGGRREVETSLEQSARPEIHEPRRTQRFTKERRPTRSALSAILDFLVPGHLDRFQFAFVRGFGITGKVRQLGDVAVQVDETHGKRIESGVRFGKQDADVFGVVPSQFLCHPQCSSET
jgi:glycosyl hydrolase family 2